MDLEVSFKKDLRKSYMIVKPDQEITDDYQMKILCGNRIPGLNHVSVRQFNNSSVLYYDISGKVSMENMYALNTLRAGDIKNLILGIRRLADQLKEYLLDIDRVLMDFSYIFIDRESKMPEFCYYPLKTENFFISVRTVLNQIIKSADHSDRETVLLAYGLQKLGMTEGFTIRDMMDFVQNGESNSAESEVSAGIENKNFQSAVNSDNIQVRDIKTRAETLQDNKDNSFSKNFGISHPCEKKKNRVFEKLKQIFSGSSLQYQKLSELPGEDPYRGAGARPEPAFMSEGYSKSARVLAPAASESSSAVRQQSLYAPEASLESRLSSQYGPEVLSASGISSPYEGKSPAASRLSSQYAAEVPSASDVSSLYAENSPAAAGVPSPSATQYATSQDMFLQKMQSLTLRSTDERHIMITPNRFPCIIGKSRKNCDFSIDCRTVSRMHLKIVEEAGGFYIEDLNSTNGTYLNGLKIVADQFYRIQAGDVLKLSEIEFIVC